MRYARRQDVVLILCELRAVVINGGPEPAARGQMQLAYHDVAIHMPSSKPMTPLRKDVRASGRITNCAVVHIAGGGQYNFAIQVSAGKDALSRTKCRCQELTVIPTPTRRHFVHGVAATGLAALVEGQFNRAAAETIARPTSVLTGNHFDLAIEAHHDDFTGRRVKAIAVNGSSPGPTLKWREGDTVTIVVTNHLTVETSIHWHGIRVPASMDGVPGLSFAGIPPGKTFVYRFPALQNGTYWYHSHSGFQEQIGLIGALVIEPRDQDPISYDRDYVVLLSDWSDTNPETLYSNLKKQSDYYNFHKRTAGTFIHDVRSRGLGSTVADRLSWGRMNMSPTDIADVISATYIYLMNGQPPSRAAAFPQSSLRQRSLPPA